MKKFYILTFILISQLLTAQAIIKRISGRGSNNFLEIDSKLREKILLNNFDGKIEYKINKGPFDVRILDQSKVKGKTFLVELEGEIDLNCKYNSENAFYKVTNITTGETIKSKNPISNNLEEVFENFGLAITILDVTEPKSENIFDNGYLEEKIIYNNPNEPNWFNCLKDKIALAEPIDNILDPVEIVYYEDGINIPKISSGSFFPLYYAKYLQNKEFLPYITPTSIEAMAIAIDENAGTLNPKDLNNVDIVFTSDKSKWSRCIVVETSSKFHKKVAPIENETMSVKPNKSVDKNGIEEESSTGFSWFPGYAVDVETGKRLNIFFGENTSLSKNNLALKNPKIADDMMFNPSDELISDTKSTGEDNLLFNYPVGGGHYIYVTRHDYDECKQLKDNLNTNSHFQKRDGLGAVTWTSMPVLEKGFNLLDYKNGVIPNDLLVSIRVKNIFFHEDKNDDLKKLKTCLYEAVNPSYELSFDFTNTTEELNIATPWSLKSSFSGFTLNNIEEDIFVTVTDLSGRIVYTKSLFQNEKLEWNAMDYDINNSVIFVKINSKKMGISKTYKIFLYR